MPNGGVLPGPRSFRWHPLEPATLAWAEALDGGNPKTTVPFRDRVSTLAAPFKGEPAEFAEDRVPLQRPGLDRRRRWPSCSEFDRTRRWTRTWVIERDGARRASCGIAAPRIATAIRARRCAGTRASGTESIVQSGDTIFLAGAGASPQGDKPFLDTLSLAHVRARRASTR